MTLRQQLDAFDGKHTAPLQTIAAEATPDLQRQLVREIPGPRETAATWVLKALAEQGRLEEKVAASVFEELAGLSDWQAMLHVLQMVQHHPRAFAVDVDTLRDLLAHPKTLVRAWALDAFVRVGPAGESRRLVNEALDAKQASIRARARQLAELIKPTSSKD